MKKLKITDWEILSLRVIGLFITAMLISYSPQLLRGFFEDKLYTEDGRWHHDWIDGKYDWGFRHYLYFWMCFILFIIQAVKIVKWIIRTSEKRNAFPVETRDED